LGFCTDANCCAGDVSGKITSPEVPAVPSADVPQIDLPTVEVPSVDAPSVDVTAPTVEATLPEASAPGASLLGVDALDTGIPSPKKELKVPDADVSLPETQIPDASVPDTGVNTFLPGVEAPEAPTVGDASMPSADATVPGVAAYEKYSAGLSNSSVCL
jgi:hypothetical protein